MARNNILHRKIAEKFNERSLLLHEVVHHIDEDDTNNDSNNLMIFKNNAAHKHFHIEQRAVKACGNKDWRHCKYCKEYDDIKNLNSSGNCYQHKRCRSAYDRNRYKGILIGG